MLRNLELKSVYDTSKCDIIEELFCPLLANSIDYKRGVGYFTSGWLNLTAKGLAGLVENGGKAQLITSPHLEPRDWDAFVKGNEAKENEVLLKILSAEVDNLKNMLEHNTLTALAWLIADGLLEIKFAIPKNKLGDFHDKFAIFTDVNGDKVAIHGSYNDSIHGTLNGESFSVFRSWNDGQSEYVDKHEQRFQELFKNRNDFFKVYNIPLAIKEKIVKLKENTERPYKVNKQTASSKIRMPDGLALYDYQYEAIDKWFDQDCRGLFEMATGTGKTFTSLSAAVQLSNKLNDRLAIVISVPFNHLVDQWKKDVVKFGFIPLLCRGTYTQWYNQVKSRVQDYNLGTRKNLVLITTHTTASASRFKGLLEQIEGDVLFIGDEVHYLGAGNMRKALLPNYNYRIGLSATPDRWFDEEGTDVIKNYFFDTVIDYPIDKAIKERFLTKYEFLPELVRFTPAEMEEYSRLTTKIRKLMSIKDEEGKEKVEKYARDRANLVAKAENKLPLFKDCLVKQIKEEGLENVKHTIVYCAPGETGEAMKIVTELGLGAKEFIYTVPIDQRQKILDYFKNGDIQVLVAIKCLDEGVNIPEIRRAYFLASTTNPREFVQRRGRILRTCPGKTEARLYDFVVIPPLSGYSGDIEHEISLLKKEMPRFAEFAGSARNEFHARNKMIPILKKYDMLHLFDKKPWDVYHENKLLMMEGYDEC
ncbi:DEAD/DEAH box helicase family protein [Geosporobacter ferrireducens]|uniref:DEAD/DEAH box helicase family protein n=1 Tax=Geosporobacter ferrireducens TaxID=1424294 RepID=UPI002357C0B7|nr:DEAD/DEAH box helicase family protein [Geosporobacter ferrireducens]